MLLGREAESPGINRLTIHLGEFQHGTEVGLHMFVPKPRTVTSITSAKLLADSGCSYVLDTSRAPYFRDHSPLVRRAMQTVRWPLRKNSLCDVQLC
jgi:hypothetical protein